MSTTIAVEGTYRTAIPFEAGLNNSLKIFTFMRNTGHTRKNYPSFRSCSIFKSLLAACTPTLTFVLQTSVDNF